MATRMNRRQALAGVGSLSLGAVLAACGDSEGTTSASPPDPTVLTTQLYFDEAVSEAVFAGDAYARGGDEQDVGNADDGIFDERTVLALSRQDEGWLGAISFDVEAA